MLELNIKAQLLPGAESEMIGIKDAIAYIVEPWVVKIDFKIDNSAPLQLTMTDKPEIRQTVTVAAAMQAIKAHNLTLEEMQNVAAALVEMTKLESS